MSKRPSNDFDIARIHALDCVHELFAPKLFQALIERIPEDTYDFKKAYPIEKLYERTIRTKTTEGLQKYLNHRATLDDAMVIAWAMHSVIQDVSEAQLNGGETYFARYKDLLSRPSTWQVALFGLQGLKAFWRG